MRIFVAYKDGCGGPSVIKDVVAHDIGDEALTIRTKTGECWFIDRSGLLYFRVIPEKKGGFPWKM